MATVKWSAFTAAAATVINGADVAPTLKNLANNGQKLGAEIDNTSNLNLYADFELYVRGASAFSAGGYAELYLIPTLDGTNYMDGDDSVAPPATALVGAFPLRAVNTQQRVVMRRVLLGPGKYKPLLINKGGQAFTNTDAENLLTVRYYNETVA